MKRSRPGGLAALRTLRLRPPNHNGALGRAISATERRRAADEGFRAHLDLPSRHDGLVGWQEAEEAGDTERAEKAFRVYDFGFDLIGC